MCRGRVVRGEVTMSMIDRFGIGQERPVEYCTAE
jgi:hypothetical protein